MSQDIISMNINDRTFNLSFDYDEEMDISSRLQIHPHNLVTEICEIAVFSNQIGNMKADVANEIKHLKLKLDISEAKLYEFYKNKLSVDKKATVKEIESLVTLDETNTSIRTEMFEKEKQLDYLDSIYWACKTKSSMLEKMSASLKPEEFQNEVFENKINYIQQQKQK